MLLEIRWRFEWDGDVRVWAGETGTLMLIFNGPRVGSLIWNLVASIFT